MKILFNQFGGKLHSWAISSHGLARGFKQLGHNIHFFSTDGIEHFPEDLKENLIGYCEENKPNKIYGRSPDNDYDCQISYTALKNAGLYLSHGNKNRFLIYLYEFTGKNSLPTGWAKCYQYTDLICSPSEFGKKVFMDSGIPESHIKVIPHGIDKMQYSQVSKINLGTNKKFKILANIIQNHLRKNIPGLLEAYGKAFTKNDDVSLILKCSKNPGDISIPDCLKKLKQKYPNHGEIKLFTNFLPDISVLYRSIDATFSLSFAEGFLLQQLEGAASGKITIMPEYNGGMKLPLIDNLWIKNKEIRADSRGVYWECKPTTKWFEPDINDAVEKLRYAYQNFEELNKKVEEKRAEVLEYYDWNHIAQLFLENVK
jgi:glycosyltransferase involved in cell wall biosynthesis